MICQWTWPSIISKQKYCVCLTTNPHCGLLWTLLNFWLTIRHTAIKMKSLWNPPASLNCNIYFPLALPSNMSTNVFPLSLVNINDLPKLSLGMPNPHSFTSTINQQMQYVICIWRTPSELHSLQQIPTQHDMLPQHLVYKNELNHEYIITLARNDKAPWWWSERTETCRSGFKCFKWKLYRCICWLIVEVILRNAQCNDETHIHYSWY